MNAIKLLKKQHQVVRDLFDRFDRADSSSDKEAIIQELADNLAAHMTIEEQLFYPVAYMENKAMFSRAVEEHMGIKRIIADLLVKCADEDDYEDKVTMLQERVEAHVEAEEDDTFKMARKLMDGEDLEHLGTEMQELFDEELAGTPCDALREQVAVSRSQSWSADQ
jgi:hypothetical protein